ncbi:MAG: hypothetical protein H7Y04_12990, partial [Verrucomicrobia bacterium]|nr:hypothetical protein [Cytophagales bacterium]
MNRDEFYQLVKQPEKIPVSLLPELEENAKKYPYTQLIHFLIAKVAHDHTLPPALMKVKKAALYATHREALKTLLNRKLSNYTDFENRQRPDLQPAVIENKLVIINPRETVKKELENTDSK